MLMSVGSSTSWMLTIDDTTVPPSLMASAAMCECASMMPGEMNLPVTSITSAPAGIVTLAPSAAILPSRRTMVPFGIVPRVTVTSVPPFSATTPGRGCAGACPREARSPRPGRQRRRPRGRRSTEPDDGDSRNLQRCPPSRSGEGGLSAEARARRRMTERRNCSTIRACEEPFADRPRSCCFAGATLVAATGGIDVAARGVAIRSRDPFRALVIGVALLLVHALVVRRGVRTRPRARWRARVSRGAPALAAVHGADARRACGAVRIVQRRRRGLVRLRQPGVRLGVGAAAASEPLPLSAAASRRTSSLAPLGYRARTAAAHDGSDLRARTAADDGGGARSPAHAVPSSSSRSVAVLLVWLTFRLGGRAGGPIGRPARGAGRDQSRSCCIRRRGR